MFYSLLYETSSHPTVELLLKLCWLPRPRSRAVRRMYTNLPHAEQARGLYIDAINNDTPAGPHWPNNKSSTFNPPQQRRHPFSSPGPTPSDTVKAGNAASPHGLDILMASMLRISRMLLGLCIGDGAAESDGMDKSLQHFGEPRSNAFQARRATGLPPRPTADLSSLSDVPETLPEAVRDTINKLSEQWALLTRALSPSSIPLGLAMLFCRSLPSCMFKLKASPSDVAALEQFRKTERGRAFVAKYEAEFGPSPQPKPPGPHTQRQQLGKELLAGELGVAAEDLPTPASMDGEISAASSMNESLATSGFGRLPLFYVPGVKLILPVQGHSVQFWPLFLSRLQLVSVLKEVHSAVAQIWSARRRAERDSMCKRIQAEVMLAFRNPMPPPSGAAARRAVDDDEDSDEPPEMQELMEELTSGNLPTGVGGGNGLLKSVELICVGTTSIVTSTYLGICSFVDNMLLAMPGGLKLLGIQRTYPIYACRLHDYLTAAQRWNATSAPLAESLMTQRHEALEREVAALLRSLSDSDCDMEQAAEYDGSTGEGDAGGDRRAASQPGVGGGDTGAIDAACAGASSQAPFDSNRAAAAQEKPGDVVEECFPDERQPSSGSRRHEGAADDDARVSSGRASTSGTGGALQPSEERRSRERVAPSSEGSSLLHVFSGSSSAGGNEQGVEHRMAELLSNAAQEWNNLVENLVGMESRGSKTDKALRRLREDERQSRLRLMRSLIAIGDDLSEFPSIDSAPGLRSTWLTVVNSLLAMDQATNLSPLLEHGPLQKICIERFKAVSGTLEYIISIGSALWWHASQDDRIVGALANPVIRQLTKPAEAARATRAGREGDAPAAEGADSAEEEIRRPAEVSGVWRVNLDLLSPPALRSDPGMSVSIEIDSAQALGKAEHDMVKPSKEQARSKPLGPPEFKGLLLVGDLVPPSNKLRLRGHPVNFGYLA